MSLNLWPKKSLNVGLSLSQIVTLTLSLLTSIFFKIKTCPNCIFLLQFQFSPIWHSYSWVSTLLGFLHRNAAGGQLRSQARENEFWGSWVSEYEGGKKRRLEWAPVAKSSLPLYEGLLSSSAIGCARVAAGLSCLSFCGKMTEPAGMLCFVSPSSWSSPSLELQPSRRKCSRSRSKPYAWSSKSKLLDDTGVF